MPTHRTRIRARSVALIILGTHLVGPAPTSARKIRRKISTEMARQRHVVGTSGTRGPAEGFHDRLIHMMVTGFMQQQELQAGSEVALGGDLRGSTPSILDAVTTALEHHGLRVVNAGVVPTPALANYAIENEIPAIMVTGSHIPGHLNGIKFYGAAGELSKEQELELSRRWVSYDDALFDGDQYKHKRKASKSDSAVRQSYINRYVDAFGSEALKGRTVFFDQASTAGGQVIPEILTRLGATVIKGNAKRTFTAMDSEMVGRSVRESLVRRMAYHEAKKQLRFDVALSTDPDSDRPLVVTRDGEQVFGDVLGIWTAQFLDATTIATPSTSNRGIVDPRLPFEEVRLTKVGSPYVNAAMSEALRQGHQRVVGFEANGGFMTGSDIKLDAGELKALPTRDAVLPMIAMLAKINKQGIGIPELLRQTPLWFKASGGVRMASMHQSRAVLARLSKNEHAAFRKLVGDVAGSQVDELDTKDGLEATLADGRIVHLRPSGNEPLFRVYIQTQDNQAEADKLKIDLEARVSELAN